MKRIQRTLRDLRKHERDLRVILLLLGILYLCQHTVGDAVVRISDHYATQQFHRQVEEYLNNSRAQNPCVNSALASGTASEFTYTTNVK